MYLLEYEKKPFGSSELVEHNRIYNQFDVDGLKWLSREQRMDTRGHEMGKYFVKSKSTKLKIIKSGNV